MAFLADFIPEQCYVTVNHKRLSAIYDISFGNVLKIRCSQRKRDQSGPSHIGRPLVLSDIETLSPRQPFTRKSRFGLKFHAASWRTISL
jgi:hypothetical protein